MFILHADKNRLTVRQREMVTSGSVNICRVRFGFSSDWEGMKRVAVFKAGGEPVSVLLDDTGECRIPWEAMETPLVRLMAGVYGTIGGEVVLPTVWADLGVIRTGAAAGQETRQPTPELWQQVLEQKADRLDFTAEGDLALYAGRKLLSSLPVQGGEGGAAPAWKIGHGLKVESGVVSVDAAGCLDGDLTRPITAAAVEEMVGNVQILLETI